MFNLSITACSFHLRKKQSKGNEKIYNLNSPISLEDNEGDVCGIADLSEVFIQFFDEYSILMKNDRRQQSFRCEFEHSNYLETPDFKMIYTKIYSGTYGSSSEIIDGNCQTIKYRKSASDIDVKPFYLMVVFPKDCQNVVVQKGMFIFQNIGPFGIKTITTDYMKEFFSKKYSITLKCRTIAPDLFIKKVIRKDNTKKLVMIKNILSSDLSDNLGKGYGVEQREIGRLRFTQAKWKQIMDKIQHVAGGRFNLFEFEGVDYDNLKVVVDIGGRTRTIDLHNLDNLSIIEAIPDEIRMADGHPDLSKLLEYIKKVIEEYLDEMVLYIS